MYVSVIYFGGGGGGGGGGLGDIPLTDPPSPKIANYKSNIHKKKNILFACVRLACNIVQPENFVRRKILPILPLVKSLSMNFFPVLKMT